MKPRLVRLAAALLGLSLALAAAGPRPVSVALGNETLAGLYWEPSKRLSPAVLLLAGAGGRKEEWIPLATRLRKEGYGVLALDWKQSGSADREERVADIRAGFEFLRAQKKVDAARIALVGADEGAEATLAFAAREPLVRLAALLAPGATSPSGAAAELPMRDYGARPLFLAAAEQDAAGVEAVNQLAAGAQGEVVRKLRPGERLTPAQGLDDDLLAFLRAHL